MLYPSTAMVSWAACKAGDYAIDYLVWDDYTANSKDVNVKVLWTLRSLAALACSQHRRLRVLKDGSLGLGDKGAFIRWYTGDSAENTIRVIRQLWGTSQELLMQASVPDEAKEAIRHNLVMALGGIREQEKLYKNILDRPVKAEMFASLARDWQRSRPHLECRKPNAPEKDHFVWIRERVPAKTDTPSAIEQEPLPPLGVSTRPNPTQPLEDPPSYMAIDRSTLEARALLEN